MRSSTLSTSRSRQVIGAALVVAALVALLLTFVLGFGIASAQDPDQHSGGSSPSNGPVDEGSPPASVAGVTESRDSGGLPVTGAEIIGITAVGGAIVIIGIAAVAASRRTDRSRVA
jgi:hypothetical protein